MGGVAAVLLSWLLSGSCWFRQVGDVGCCWWCLSQAVVMAGHRGLQGMPGPLRLRMWVSNARRGLWRPSGLPGVPGLPRWSGLGVQGASVGLDLLGFREAGATPTPMAAGVLCGPVEHRL
jgi:hypothetical protein